MKLIIYKCALYNNKFIMIKSYIQFYFLVRGFQNQVKYNDNVSFLNVYSYKKRFVQVTTQVKYFFAAKHKLQTKDKSIFNQTLDITNIKYLLNIKLILTFINKHAKLGKQYVSGFFMVTSIYFYPEYDQYLSSDL